MNFDKTCLDRLQREAYVYNGTITLEIDKPKDEEVYVEYLQDFFKDKVAVRG